jgi:putative nucleotidyltransferase with HDIG domain
MMTSQSVEVGQKYVAGTAKVSQRPPSLALELLELIRNPSTNTAKLVAIISEEPMLCERVLRVANSPALGVRTRVSNLSYAITLLGFDALRETVMPLLALGSFRKLVNLLAEYEQFWNHSVSCAVAARIMALRIGRCNASDAFTAGLFHDIGMVLSATEQPSSALRFEAGILQRDSGASSHHEEISAWMAEQWGMADRIVEAIRYHHTPAHAHIDPILTATVHVADVLSQRIDFGHYAHDRLTGYDPSALDILDLTEDNLTTERLGEEIARIRAGVEGAPDFEQLVRGLKGVLVDSLGTLPGTDRLLLALHYQEGLPLNDVAQLLGMTEDDVRALHHSTMSRLLKTIQEYV